MKVRTVAALAGILMMLSSLSVWSLTDPARQVGPSQTLPRRDRDGASSERSRSEFSSGSVVRLEGRLGHHELATNRQKETFALFRIKGTGEARAVERRAAMHLVIVIDRSGSMAGRRLVNALAAARGAVARLSEGDVVSVVDYSSSARLLVPPTKLDGPARERVSTRLAGIVADGETCISCGLEKGLEALRDRGGLVDRVLLLSDGEPTTGVQSQDGLREVAERIRRAGASVTTVGVDVDYNERLMAAIAQQSNGRHYFVENPAGLPEIFDRELDGLERTVARRAELGLEAPEGVELVEVMDRSFRRDGGRLFVDLGSIAEDEEKTVLVRVRVDPTRSGAKDLISARLRYEEARSGRDGECEGVLAARFVSEPESDALDPLVEERVLRSATLGTLTEANRLFDRGDAESARRRLNESLETLKKSRSAAVAKAAPAKRREVEEQFARQEAALGAAASAFATPPPGVSPSEAVREGKAGVRRNQAAAADLAF
jgi:Ca-activated chloride channel family protein